MAQQQSGSSRNEKKETSGGFEITSGNLSQNIDSWARFLVIEAADNLPIKLNPFAVSKAVSRICGEVKNATRLRSWSLLVECARRQQSLKVLSISTFANIEVAVSVHRTLNSCRGIVHDRARCLSDMSEEEIATELEDQAVNAVKRFTFKEDGVITKTNTYLMTFPGTFLPQSIKAGYFHIGVDVSVKEPVNQSKTKEMKELIITQPPIVPSPLEVPLQTSLGPLDMEVTLSSQDRRRSSSSAHSRERSPIEPP
ncbi:uncharacterized protein [Haliotis cracherodii]|uniref:uncharacterized protein n=1 Tax=Haliotis cracherodii TaxID=6455 RepID=UPI0039E7A3E2